MIFFSKTRFGFPPVMVVSFPDTFCKVAEGKIDQPVLPELDDVLQFMTYPVFVLQELAARGMMQVNGMTERKGYPAAFELAGSYACKPAVFFNTDPHV